jgi:signal transduction histidine kinase
VARPDERRRTDASLRAEREKTDRELAARRSAIHEDADDVLAEARLAADAVLRLARSRADELLDSTGASDQMRKQVEGERSRHDQQVESERAASDSKLVGQREDRTRSLTRLLATERLQTDEHLTVERSRADSDVTARDDLLGMTSHDLRTLVQATAMASTALLRLEGAPEVTRLAKVIQRSAGQMSALLSDLLDVVTIEAGGLRIIPEQHTVAPVIAEVASTFQPLASEKGISLTTTVSSDVSHARFDRGRILQVLSNLVGNAMKFTNKGGHVAIRAEMAASDVRFSVIDDGCGIPADRLETIFERYRQVSPSDRRGVGLGLYIAKRIVEAHGGSISVESAEGSGSAFRFSLPGAQARS